MKNISIVKYGPNLKDDWNNFIAEAKNATFLFHRDFLEYHGDLFKDESLLIFKNDKIIALFPANGNGKILYSHQGLSYGGLVVKKEMKFEMFLKCFKLLLMHLEENGIETLQIKPLPQIYSSHPNQEFSFISQILEARLIKRHLLSVIDLKEDFKINNNRLEGKKRGEKHGLEIIEEPNFEAFWSKILIPNLSLKHKVKPVHTIKEITLLHQRFPKHIRQFNVYHKGIIVAGTTIFETKQLAHAQYISGNSDNNMLGSLDFLYFHLIENVFKDKKFFDFGTSNENEGRNINQGLLFWKEGFGARAASQDFYEIIVANHYKLDSVFI